MAAISLSSLHAESSPDAVLRISIRHGAVNEMGTEQLRDWEAVTRFLVDGGAKALITTSDKRTKRGTPIFVAGANVTERAGWSDAQVKKHVRWQRATLAALRRAPVFHAVVVDGLALGWGTEFLLTADYRIATRAAQFALPETGIGILPGAGGTSELSRIVGPNQALRLGMTGERIAAEEALRIGLVDELFDSVDAATERAEALAAMAARRSPTAVAAFKQGVLESLGMDEGERTELEARAYEVCVDSGEAAIGRAHFKAITAGEAVEWGPRAPLKR
ncbi:MAG: enoyl-CoA hydratase/isomerase family protein [Myxococcota bacterium]|nr:enoyl-CoA hydratase/isomerase family protein [Myxococcota bacterium]